MNFDQLQEMWARQPVGEVPLAAEREMLVQVKTDSQEFDAIIRWRDRRELLAGLTLAAVFAVIGLVPHGAPFIKWPFVAASGCMLFLTLFLVTERLLAAGRRRPEAHTLLGDIASARENVCRQVWLLRNVAWWYLLPAQTGWWLFGLGIVSNGRVGPDRFWPVILVVQLLWGWWLWRSARRIYRLNQDAVRDDLRPRLKKLDDLAAEWRQAD